MAKVLLHMSGRARYRLMAVAVVALLLFYTSTSIIPAIFFQWPKRVEFFSWEHPDAVFPEKRYKPAPAPVTPVPDPFPLLSQNPPPKRSLLQAPEANRPPRRHHPERTPLFVGFTRNWPQLLQCVVSYIAAGWPPEDIYVVENTGVMFANRDGKLTLQNPFYLNHTQLRMLGVNVMITPTLLTFAQLQNFYLWTALNNDYPYFFWTHQDLLVFSHEHNSSSTATSGSAPPPSLYANAVATLRYLLSPAAPKWAHHFFAYDHLTLVNRDAVLSVGGWDTHIPYYATDCDMYVRLMWAGFWQGESEIGIILDVASVMADVGALLRIPGIRARLVGEEQEQQEQAEEDDDEEEEKKWVAEHGERWERLVQLGYRMEAAKYSEGNAWRNTWQIRQRGGQGEPFYRDAEGFETGVKMMIDTGRAVFAEKWGHRGCDIAKAGRTPEDAWRLERDWDVDTEGAGFQGHSW
ncbi:uncharacterized protein THITE_2148402 [Thermothielavioides terrestris NRRL 8126]|uniref:Uncharacterized protein n=1 Tax=Thermothielavioides terrestris (strain ATCC 38088 / NRRL 8126) TaxID=578455 RepID=G2RG58_THETT|nr:uncharacterized protein THITE_2148402 [Thermothielavioides terrestris NRRL 8126]AEO71801.1 hypothetical protein THITE_2148402 [Thermothielavioides terrestris NRRL 8126]